MVTEDRFGNVMQSSLRLETRPKILHKKIGDLEISIVEATKSSPDKILSDSFPAEDTYIVNVPLSEYRSCENWEEGRYASIRNLRPGATIIADLKRDPRFVIDRAFHAVHFLLPRSAFDVVADNCDARRIGELKYEVGKGYSDRVVGHLVGAARPALSRPEEASGMFVEYLSFALAAHLARTYGNLRELCIPVRGGLARWQERRAYELIEANLDGELSVSTLAAECRLSVAHFSRAFRQTAGMPPHRWLMRRRIEAALELMRNPRQTLADIALATGFADQSHFTHAFKRRTGMSPASWRRAREIAPAHDHD